MGIVFQEKQKFTQWWLWFVLFAIISVPLYNFVDKEILPNTFFVIVMGLIIVLFITLKLTTIISSKHINMSYFPFLSKDISWDEIENASIINYGFVGGWGIRLWTKYGTVYNVKGDIGFLLKLKNGKSFVIGTQKENKLREALNKLKKLNE